MRFFNWLKTSFLTGLAVIAPFGLVLLFVYKLLGWIFSLVSAVPAKIIEYPVSDYHLPEWVFNLAGIVCTVLLVVLAGSTAKNIISKSLVRFGESIILRIPLIRTAYNASKQILNTLFITSEMKKSGRVVVFEYPKENVYSMGFLMGRMKAGEGHNVLDETLVNIFVPTTPNPTSGFYVMVPESKVKEVPMSVDQAFNVIISGGLSSSSRD